VNPEKNITFPQKSKLF